MMYLVEAVQRNRVVKVVLRTPSYERAESEFQRIKKLMYREARMLKHDAVRGRILLKFIIKGGSHSTVPPFRG